MVIEGIRSSVFPTTAAFGPSFVERHDSKQKKNLHFSGSLVLGRPIHGDGKLQVVSEGTAVVCRRGKVTFLDKARAVEAAGGVVMIVCQSDDVWPYVMTDRTNSSAGLKIPAIMLSQKDGNRLVELTGCSFL